MGGLSQPGGGDSSEQNSVSQSAPSGAAMAVGDTIFVSKLANTSRNNTAALTTDPDLQVTGLPVGHYKVEFNLLVTLGAGFFNYRPDAPGTIPMTSVRACPSGTTDAQIVDNATEGFCLSLGLGRFHAVGSTPKAMPTGTIAVFWAQDAANADPTIMLADSWISVTRLN